MRHYFTASNRVATYLYIYIRRLYYGYLHNAGLQTIFSLFHCVNRSLESNSYNKASELQEEICAKKLEWRMAQLHLAAVKAQVYTTKKKSNNSFIKQQ